MTQKRIVLESGSALRRPVRRGGWLALVMLCALFLALCLWYAAAHAPQEAPRPQTAHSFVQLIPDAQKPDSVTITRGESAFTLLRRDGAFLLEGDETALDPHAAGELLACGESILARRRLEGSPADFGVTDQSLRAQFHYPASPDFVLKLGDPVPTGEGWYAAVDGAVYIVNNALARTLSTDRMSLYALPDLAQRFTAQTLQKATIVQPDREPIAIARVLQVNPFNTMVELTSPIAYPANSERAAEVYLALEKLRPTAMLATHGSDEEWGLDDPVALITLEDAQTTRMTIGLCGEGYAMRLDSDPAVYALPSDALDFLGSLTVPWLAEQLPGLVMLSEVSAIDLSTPEGSLHFDVNQPQHSYCVNGQTIAEETFLPAYQQLIGLLIERYVPQPENRGEERLKVEYTFTNGSRWALSLCAYDDAFDLIVRGDCARFLISRARTDELIQTLFALQEVQP